MISRTGINERFGFTLIEILLVLLILGIMAGLAVPNLSRTYSTILLKRTTSDLVSLMRYAQSRALIQRQVFQLTLDLQTKRYRLSPIAGRLGRAFEIPREIRVLTENPAIDFQPDGKITKASWLLCDKDHCLRISTKEQSGYVRVFEED